MNRRAVIQGTGHGVPAKILTNSDLEKMVDTSDEWITQRTGIKERRICEDHEAAADLAIKAANEALAKSGKSAAELDLILVSTVSADYIFPSTSCLVQHAIGAKNAASMDIGAACAGFIYGVSTADAFIQAVHHKIILVVCVYTLTKFVDW